jgi:hypothetical protein
VGVCGFFLSFYFTILTYVCLIAMQPVNPVNFFAYIRSPGVLDTFSFVSHVLIALVYSTAGFLMLSTIQFLKGTLQAALLVICFLVPLVVYFIIRIGYVMNLSMKSGAWSNTPIMEPECHLLDMTPEETERILYRRAEANDNNGNIDDYIKFYEELKPVVIGDADTKAKAKQKIDGILGKTETEFTTRRRQRRMSAASAAGFGIEDSKVLQHSVAGTFM